VVRIPSNGPTLIAIVVLGTLAFAMPWSRDMERGPAVTHYERIVPPPPGVLSVRGERPMSRDDAGAKLTSPIARSPEVLEKGKFLFDTYCAVCHGPTAQGDGPVGKQYAFKIPPLTDDFFKERSDGHLYGTIREGGFLMPGYAEVMTPEERWMVVHYLRSLQGE
jgi:hypothetical protein